MVGRCFVERLLSGDRKRAGGLYFSQRRQCVCMRWMNLYGFMILRLSVEMRQPIQAVTAFAVNQFQVAVEEIDQDGPLSNI